MVEVSEIKHHLQNFSADEFELLIAELWSAMGWSTEVTSHSQDQGVDIIAKKSGVVEEKAVIQAKCYSSGNKVGRPEIQQYNTLKQQEKAVDTVIVVTSSGFTDGAESLANSLNIKTVDGFELGEACLNHLPEESFSDIKQSSDNSQPKKPQSAVGSISTDELSESEQDLARAYQSYFVGLAESKEGEKTLFFDLESDSSETDEYVVKGITHHIKFSSDSPKLLAQLQQTADKYGWEVLRKEAYAQRAGGIEMIVPIEEGTSFHIAIDTNRDESPTAERQARISKLILDRVYDQKLSGTEVTELGSNYHDDSVRRVIK